MIGVILADLLHFDWSHGLLLESVCMLLTLDSKARICVAAGGLLTYVLPPARWSDLAFCELTRRRTTCGRGMRGTLPVLGGVVGALMLMNSQKKMEITDNFFLLPLLNAH